MSRGWPRGRSARKLVNKGGNNTAKSVGSSEEAGVDERRFRLALDTITETIEGFGEDTIVAAMRVILDQFNYEVVVRDPGPDDDVASGNVWPRESDADLVARAFPGKVNVIDMRRRLS